jgi:hypothetical protein
MLKNRINELEEKIHPILLFEAGVIGTHPDGSPDLEALAIMKVALEHGITANDFQSLSMRFNDLNLKDCTGYDYAVNDIHEQIDAIIPLSSENNKESILCAVLACSARRLVWQPKTTEKCRKLAVSTFECTVIVYIISLFSNTFICFIILCRH